MICIQKKKIDCKYYNHCQVLDDPCIFALNNILVTKSKSHKIRLESFG